MNTLYYLKNKERIKEKRKKRYLKNKEKELEQNKKYYQEHIDDISKYQEKYRIRNSEELKKYKQSYYSQKKGRGLRLAEHYRRTDKQMGRGECSLTGLWIHNYIFSQKCVYCGEEDWTKLGCDRKDNSKPHTEDNVVPCCVSCNKKRGTKSFKEFVAECNAEERVKEWEEFLKQK